MALDTALPVNVSGGRRRKRNLRHVTMLPIFPGLEIIR